MAKSIAGGVEIVNTLSTKNDGDYPLVKAESVGMNDGTTAEEVIKGKLDKNQGASNKGKVLGIGSDGNVIPVDAPTGGGGSGFSGDYNDLINKPTIPSKLSELTGDNNHRTVSDTEKQTWNNKAEKSEIPNVTGLATKAEVEKKANKGTTLTEYGITDATPKTHETDNNAHADIRNDVTSLKEDLKGFVPKNQGVENNGKILGIGEDGLVVPIEKPSGGSGGGVDLDATLTSPDKAAPAKVVGELKEGMKKYAPLQRIVAEVKTDILKIDGVEVSESLRRNWVDGKIKPANNEVGTSLIEIYKTENVELKNGTYAIFDKDKNFIRGGYDSPIILNKENGDAYIQFNYSSLIDFSNTIFLTYPKYETLYQEYDKKIYDTENKLDIKILELGKNVNDSKEKINEAVVKYNPCVIDKNTAFVNGYLNAGDGTFIKGGNKQNTTDFIKCKKDVAYRVEIKYTNNSGAVMTTPRAFCIYNSDKVFSRAIASTSELENFKMQNNEKYIRLNYVGTLEFARVYEKRFGYNVFNEINNNTYYKRMEDVETTSKRNSIEISDLKTSKSDKMELTEFTNASNFWKPRKPIISFVIDGNWDLNDTMEAIFRKHGYKVGFAPQYDSVLKLEIPEILERYLRYQNEYGHEILSHLSYSTGDNTPFTDELVLEHIRSASEDIRALGLNVHGAVALGGSVAGKFYKYIENYFDYCASVSNRDGDRIPYHTKEENPYYYWRYGMQLSTLEQQKRAIDLAIENKGLLMFYGHAKSTNTDNFTVENLELLLTYLDEKVKNFECKVMKPFEAIKEFHAIKLEDFYDKI